MQEEEQCVRSIWRLAQGNAIGAKLWINSSPVLAKAGVWGTRTWLSSPLDQFFKPTKCLSSVRGRHVCVPSTTRPSACHVGALQ